MPCYFPLHAYRGKSKDVQKTLITFKRSDSWKGQEIDLPCGQCIGCRLERARMWAVRCVHEASMYEDNCFVTLTYNDENLPKDGSLCLRDFQLFMKRLRKSTGKRIRYFHCGEYGESCKNCRKSSMFCRCGKYESSFGRPHYHALLFNHDFKDKEYFTENNGYRSYTSSDLSSLWVKGFSLVAGMSFDSAGYVARYSLKKITGEKAADYYGDLAPEYATMSRFPGIGKKWFDRFSSDVYPRDRVVINGCYTRPPRYYDNLLGKMDPSALALLKIKREDNEKFVTDFEGGREIIVSDSSDRRLIEKEKTKRGQIRSLFRHKDGNV